MKGTDDKKIDKWKHWAARFHWVTSAKFPPAFNSQRLTRLDFRNHSPRNGGVKRATPTHRWLSDNHQMEWMEWETHPFEGIGEETLVHQPWRAKMARMNMTTCLNACGSTRLWNGCKRLQGSNGTSRNTFLNLIVEGSNRMNLRSNWSVQYRIISTTIWVHSHA